MRTDYAGGHVKNNRLGSLLRRRLDRRLVLTQNQTLRLEIHLHLPFRRGGEMEAWYMNETDEDQRLPHHCDPKQFVSVEKLAELGVLYWHLEDVDNVDTNEELQQIRKSRGYSYSDMITCSPDKLPNYDQKLRSFFEEHIHTDEEIRLVLEGSGYFDVRDEGDRWIRIWVKQGDLIVLPAGIYHRFTMDSSNYTKAMRLFVGEPVWTPYNRPQDDNPVRKGYLDNFFKKEESSSALEAH